MDLKASGTFPIVGIGASAGGFAALLEFFKSISPETGMAFVVVQHLDPSHPSHSSEILARATKIPIRNIEDGMTVEANHVYLIPANATLALKNSEAQPPRRAGKGVSTKLPPLKYMEKELHSARSHLQMLVEREQASKEELKAANEEILSSNEELQCTNEELETAKEKLQSINEELSTLNSELQDRNRQLAITNDDLNNLITSVRIPVIIVSRDLLIRRFTPGAEKLMNLIPGYIGQALGDIKMKIEIPGLLKMLTDAIDSVTVVQREVCGADNRWFSLLIRPYLTADKKIDGAVIVLFDIDSLKRGRDYAESIIETVRESLLVLDAKFKVRSANRSFYELFRTNAGNTEGKLVYELGNGQWNIPALRTILETSLPIDGKVQNIEVSHEFPNIGNKTVILNARKVRTLDGEEELTLIAIDDITARKKIELALALTADNLVKTNTELEQFAYVASHDLQEPLRMVATYMELLKKEYRGKQLDANAEGFIDIAVQSAARMKTLVDDLLSLSRTGREDLQFNSTDLNLVLDQVITNLQPALEESHAVIKRDPIPTISTNPLLIGQVFQNLIANAIKFRGAATPQIFISAKEMENDLEFSVRDNGIGISTTYQEQIFIMFQRLYSQEQYKGTGIGLAICKRIIERYGGRIWVESDGVNGAEFKFTLPKVWKEAGAA